MTIRQIEIYKSPIKLKEPFVISLGPVYSADNVVVVVRTNNGVTGFGECSPFMTINGESMDTCFIVGQYLAKGLIGKDPLDIDACSVIMNKIIYGNSSIKSAFDIALYDIASKNANLPLYSFLGGKNNKKLITDYTVSIGDPQKMAADAVKIKNNGFQIIKVKLGHTGITDVERIKLIRNAIGPDISLRVDANQGWSTKEAIETLQALNAYKIEFCEEPVPRWNYMDLPYIRKMSPVPIMADESCCDHHDAKRLIDINACDMFNVKLGKSSGLFYALKIVAIAEMAGIKIQIGGFLESRLGFTASAHLALVSENIICCDFDTPLMFTDDPVVDGITYAPDGVITITEVPGLGASFDEDYLKSLDQIKIK
jgi:L-alanine-DL-glutamate epimerase-like enolase superfamily enzyme